MFDLYVFGALFVLGTILGSFLNVVILRFNTGWSVSKGRSMCFSCGKVLGWRELFPIWSFLVQKGRCEACGSKISWQYPAVELAMGLSLPLAYFLSSPALFVPLSAVLGFYILIFAYDLRHKIIPDAFSYLAALAGLSMIFINWIMTGYTDILNVAAGPVLFLFFYVFWYVSKGAWMGLGDAKLVVSIGWVLGFWHGLAAILLAFWIGAVVSLLFIAFQKSAGGKRIGLKSHIPFGPFMIIGFLASLLLDIDIQSILLFLAV